MKSMLIAATAMALPLAACADNRLVEGAAVGAAVGAGVGAVTDDVSVGEGAAAGAAVGAAVGYFIDDDDDCDGYDRHGRYDRDCYD
ncbi:YMGG-like glycine zipper-containing protein [Allosphingosinicella sp.]|uniref:YMGG-like glycine zipper-containing protein n=1 Tax=Allosphingosinicella sp. TaxID=2823234 RepID=UPI002FC14DFB